MHLGKMPVLAKSPNIDLSKGFTIPQIAEKHAYPLAPLSIYPAKPVISSI